MVMLTYYWHFFIYDVYSGRVCELFCLLYVLIYHMVAYVCPCVELDHCDLSRKLFDSFMSDCPPY